MYKVNALGSHLWVQKLVAPCQWNKANVNKPDTLETFNKMPCYPFPYIICHMTPQLNLLLQKNSTSSCWFPWDLDIGKTTQKKGVREGTAFAFSFWWGNDFLQLADQELALSLPGTRTWNEDLEHTQMRIKMQPQVIIDGNKQLEKAVTSYTNARVMPSAFVCPVRWLYSSFHNDPVFSFTLSPTSTGMPNANLPRVWSHPGKTQGLPPYRVSQ